MRTWAIRATESRPTRRAPGRALPHGRHDHRGAACRSMGPWSHGPGGQGHRGGARPLPAPLTGPPGFQYYLIVLSLYGNSGPGRPTPGGPPMKALVSLGDERAGASSDTLRRRPTTTSGSTHYAGPDRSEIARSAGGCSSIPGGPVATRVRSRSGNSLRPVVHETSREQAIARSPTRTRR
jgi:hypothetical protein